MTPKMQPAAIGFRAHTGWAAVLLLGGPLDRPVVLDRRRVDLRGASVPFEVYHAARSLALLKAEALIEHAREIAEALGGEATRGMMEDSRARGCRVVACGVVLGGGWRASPLDAIFRSHPACHAAEGELYRSSLMRACRLLRLPVTGIRERDLQSACAAALGVSEAVARQRVADLGRELGPPWRQAQKNAALVAWLALLARRS